MTDVLVLCYHAVSPTWPATVSIRPEALENQLAYLVRRGWHAVTFSQAVLHPSAPRTLAITFDDAFDSVKTYALPVLESLGLPATLFAPTSYVTSGERFAWDGIDHWLETSHAGELQPMSWNDLGGLLERGWEVGSHTVTHPYLTGLDDQTLQQELEASREECQRRLGNQCDTLAYPYGDVDDRVMQHVARAGYRAATTLPSSLEPIGLLRWPRVGIYPGDGRWRFRAKVSRTMRAVRASRLWLPPS